MAGNKTQPIDANVAGYIASIADEARRADCLALIELMQAITLQPPRLWGAGIIAFGSYHYRYESGREGDMCIAGFASRKGDLSIYLPIAATGQEALLAQLGRHRMGKGCLYVRRLADVDMRILRQIVAGSVANVRCAYG